MTALEFLGGVVLASVPDWYPMLCVEFDLFLVGFIVALALLRE